ncbi:MAG: outer membrane beta-barrel protein [bacterium]
MKRTTLIIVTLLFFLPAKAFCDESHVRSRNAGFELSGYINTAMGFQHFSNDPVTEVAYDGSSGGSMGEWLPITSFGGSITPGEDFFEIAVPNVELDIVKHFGDRARLRADLQVGRPNSGSQVGTNTLSHAYAAVTLSKKYGLELVVGRFGLPPGFEPYEAYYNDTVSWSIIWRGLIAPGSGTGVMLTWSASDYIDVMVAAVNGLINDSLLKDNNLKTFIGSMLVTWGDEAQPSTFALSPFGGPESGGNRPMTIGADGTLTWWINKRWQLGLEATYQRDNAIAGNPASKDTSYLAGLINIHWEPDPAWYAVARYTTSWQNGPGNVALNLTGAEQMIHEITLGMGHFISDGVKFKLEGRFDIVSPKSSARQWIAGGAMGLSCAY